MFSDFQFSSLHQPWQIGVDVGGTFTDLVLMDAAGAVWPYKSPSVPANPAIGVIRAIEGAAAALGTEPRFLLEGCNRFVHGTTVATNTLLERKGAKVGLLVTAGARDSLEIRRGHRALMWDHRTPWRDVLVPRQFRRGVIERLNADGSVLTPLVEASVVEAVRDFRDAGIEAIAIGLLHAYRNDSHEQRCAEIARAECPNLHVTTSAALAPIVGEYERISTVVANAYVAPSVVPYLEQLEADLKAMGLKARLLLIQSNGGAVSLEHIRARPAALALSGPAAGLASLKRYGALAGTDNLIAIEIGGTSCDVTVVSKGETAETDLLDIDETLIALPSVEIHTVGTGGGTICGVDEGGLPFAGPRGAGARPGPACYGFGGTKPTVTDAQMTLGRLRPGSYAGGSIMLDKGLADEAIRRDFAAPLGLDVPAAARAMIEIADQQIQHAVEKVSLERGLDPARYTLVGAGGAGALHVAEVARRLGMRRAFVPRLAGVFCAFGMCNSAIRHDLVRPLGWSLDDAALAKLKQVVFQLEQEGMARLAEDGFSAGNRSAQIFVDLRYSGQQWTIRLPLAGQDAAALHLAFDQEHEKLYASSQADGRIDIVNIRVSAYSMAPPAEMSADNSMRAAPEPREERALWLSAGAEPAVTPVYQGEDLLPGHRFSGPALIEERTTTILIGRGDAVTVDPYGNYMIDIAPKALRSSLG